MKEIEVKTTEISRYSESEFKGVYNEVLKCIGIKGLLPTIGQTAGRVYWRVEKDRIIRTVDQDPNSLILIMEYSLPGEPDPYSLVYHPPTEIYSPDGNSRKKIHEGGELILNDHEFFTGTPLSMDSTRLKEVKVYQGLPIFLGDTSWGGANKLFILNLYVSDELEPYWKITDDGEFLKDGINDFNSLSDPAKWIYHQNLLVPENYPYMDLVRRSLLGNLDQGK